MNRDILFFSGAGISAESGIPTFRGDDGLWNNHKIEEVCQISTWLDNYDKVHKFYSEMRRDLKNKKPNEAHIAIAKLQQQFPDKVTVITQNVDDLFERAGCTKVHHLHGEVTKMRCTSCETTWDTGYEVFKTEDAICPFCNNASRFKPDVIFFGEATPKYAELHQLLLPFFNPRSVAMVIGSSGEVVPIDDIIGKLPCIKILNNLEPSSAINEMRYHEVFYENATDVVKKVVARFLR